MLDPDQEASFVQSGKDNSAYFSDLTAGSSGGLKQIKLLTVKKAKAIAELAARETDARRPC